MKNKIFTKKTSLILGAVLLAFIFAPICAKASVNIQLRVDITSVKVPERGMLITAASVTPGVNLEFQFPLNSAKLMVRNNANPVSGNLAAVGGTPATGAAAFNTPNVLVAGNYAIVSFTYATGTYNAYIDFTASCTTTPLYYCKANGMLPSAPVSPNTRNCALNARVFRSSDSTWQSSAAPNPPCTGAGTGYIYIGDNTALDAHFYLFLKNIL